MTDFIPPTFGKPIAAETQGGEDARYSLWRHYGTPIQVGYNVLITGGTATPSPGVVGPTAGQVAAADAGSGENGKAWFRGGCTYDVSSAEETILTNAGYEVGGDPS